MISLLRSIVDHFVCWVQTAVVTVINDTINALAALVGVIVIALPDMPDLPSMPSWLVDGMGWVGYWFPISFLLTLLAVVITLRVVWMAVQIPLRWAKADPK